MHMFVFNHSATSTFFIFFWNLVIGKFDVLKKKLRMLGWILLLSVGRWEKNLNFNNKHSLQLKCMYKQLFKIV